jgi:hypothetical protein
MANTTPEITLAGDILKLHIYDKLSVIPFNTEFNIKEWEYVDFIRRSWWAPGIRRISSQHKLAPDERRLVPTPSNTSFILQFISKSIASSRKSVLKVFQIFP